MQSKIAHALARPLSRCPQKFAKFGLHGVDIKRSGLILSRGEMPTCSTLCVTAMFALLIRMLLALRSVSQARASRETEILVLPVGAVGRTIAKSLR